MYTEKKQRWSIETRKEETEKEGRRQRAEIRREETEKEGRRQRAETDECLEEEEEVHDFSISTLLH